MGFPKSPAQLITMRALVFNYSLQTCGQQHRRSYGWDRKSLPSSGSFRVQVVSSPRSLRDPDARVLPLCASPGGPAAVGPRPCEPPLARGFFGAWGLDTDLAVMVSPQIAWIRSVSLCIMLVTQMKAGPLPNHPPNPFFVHASHKCKPVHVFQTWPRVLLV